MKGDGYTITGERRNYGCLVADTVKPILGYATEVALRDMSDGDRFFEKGLRTAKPHLQVGAVLIHLR